MDISKLSSIIILFIFISFTVADEEIKTAVVDNENKLKLDCEDDSTTHILVSKGFWTDDFNTSCPNRSFWNTLGVVMGVYLKCQNKQNCNLDFTNITITNCTSYKKYLHVKYMCNITETTTTEEGETMTTESSTESSRQRPRKLPKITMEPKYIPQPVPALLTTKKPSNNYVPSPWMPGPIIQPPNPWFQDSSALYDNYGGYRLPVIFPLPLPIPRFG